MTFAGKAVLITGGGTGIGAACARRFAAAEAQVAIMGRRAAPLEAVAEEVSGLALVGDASRTDDMKAAVARMAEAFGKIDVVVASAGGHGLSPVLETDDAAWARSLDANLNTAFVAARETLPHLIDSRGTMVLVSSIAGLAAGPDVCGYTTAKHALTGLTRSLARDYGPQGVRVNTVCPGWVRTPIADEEMAPLMDHHDISLDDAYALVTRDVPLRRPASAEEIAGVCCALAGHDFSIVAGAIIAADGGATIVDVPTLAFARLTEEQQGSEDQ